MKIYRNVVGVLCFRFESVPGVALLALVTPVLAKESVWIVFVIRFLQVLIVLIIKMDLIDQFFTFCIQGVLEAFAFPALHQMISMWVPEKEKSAFVSFAYVGGTFGSIITNPMCGAILATLGWEVSRDKFSKTKYFGHSVEFYFSCQH